MIWKLELNNKSTDFFSLFCKGILEKTNQPKALSYNLAHEVFYSGNCYGWITWNYKTVHKGGSSPRAALDRFTRKWGFKIETWLFMWYFDFQFLGTACS